MFDSYEMDGLFDEMFDKPGVARQFYQPVHQRLTALGSAALAQRRRMADVCFRNQGITFTVYKDTAGVEKIFPFDLVPRIIPAAEWRTIEEGLVQRITALNMFCHDIYHRQSILREKIIDPELIYGAKMLRREMMGVNVPQDIYIHICGTDLIRDAQGRYLVLEDNCRSPSGVSYVLENRAVMKRVFPALFHNARVRAIEDYPHNLLCALKHISPRPSETPCIVVLTPGVFNSAYFEHSFLARQMGVELVEGRDLLVENNFVYMRTTAANPVSEILGHGRGVCQDFAHLMIATLRKLGVPTRYVSGYIHAGRQSYRGTPESHAWCEVYFPSAGWLAFDPTNNCMVGEQFVKVGLGRSYRDVPPHKGVFRGFAAESIAVGVATEELPEVSNRSVGERFTPLGIPVYRHSARGAALRWALDEQVQQQQQQQNAGGPVTDKIR